jgi:hypothetical protein
MESQLMQNGRTAIILVAREAAAGVFPAFCKMSLVGMIPLRTNCRGTPQISYAFYKMSLVSMTFDLLPNLFQ